MKTIYLTLFLTPFFYLVRKNVTFHALIHHGNHTEVFQYLSNVSKFHILNPTIMDVTRWEEINETNFYVEYTECLSQLPVVKDHARAHYQVKQEEDGSHDLLSQHLTCFFTNFLCLTTYSTLQISQNSKSDVSYRENISYSCPWILSKFCIEEIAFQRRMIISKLHQVFSKPKHQPQEYGFNKKTN